MINYDKIKTDSFGTQCNKKNLNLSSTKKNPTHSFEPQAHFTWVIDPFYLKLSELHFLIQIILVLNSTAGRLHYIPIFDVLS